MVHSLFIHRRLTKHSVPGIGYTVMGKSDAVPACGLDMKPLPHRARIVLLLLPASLSLDSEMSRLRYLAWVCHCVPLEVGSVCSLLMPEPSSEGLLPTYSPFCPRLRYGSSFPGTTL